MKTIAFIGLFLVSITSWSQDTLYYKNPVTFHRLYIEQYQDIPLKSLQDKFKKVHHTSMWFRNEINTHNFIDFGFDLGFVEKPRMVQYRYNDNSIKLESQKTHWKIGIRYAWVLYFDRKHKASIELCSTLGYSSLTYKVPDWDETNRENFDKSGNLNTIFASELLKFNYKGIGVFAGYNLTPHQLFTKNFESDFGSESYSLGININL